MKKILFAVVATVLVCSCAKDDAENTVVNDKANLVYREFTADVAAVTRAHLGTPDTENGTIDVYLDAGDEILFVNENAEAATVAISKIENGLAYISGEVPEGTLTACYPAWAYDNDNRNAWDVFRGNATYGELNIDKCQFYNYCPSKSDDYWNNNANKNDEWLKNSMPVAMTATIDADNHLTFTADDNVATLVVPVTGDIRLQKILLYYTSTKPLEFNGNNTKPDYELHFIDEQLTSEPKNFYFLVPKDDAKYISLEFQTSTIPASAESLGTDSRTIAGYDELRRENGRQYGFRYMRRVTSKTFAVNGVTQMPVTDLTSSVIDAYRYVVHFGSANQDKNCIPEGYATAADFKGHTNGNTVTTYDNYAEVQIKHNKGTVEVGQENQWRADFGVKDDKTLIPVDAGSYRYFAVKTDARVVTQNTADYWNKAAGSIQLNLSYDDASGSKVYYEKWQNRDCKSTTHFTFCYTDEDGVEVLVFDMHARWRNYPLWLSTSRMMEFHNFKLVVPDMKRTLVDTDFDADGNLIFEAPSYKIYWMGFFSCPDEITYYMKNN